MLVTRIARINAWYSRQWQQIGFGHYSAINIFWACDKSHFYYKPSYWEKAWMVQFMIYKIFVCFCWVVGVVGALLLCVFTFVINQLLRSPTCYLVNNSAEKMLIHLLISHLRYIENIKELQLQHFYHQQFHLGYGFA